MRDEKKSRILFETVGSPIGTGTYIPSSAEVEDMTEYAFKSRIGLLFLDECVKRGVQLGDGATELHSSLTARRLATDEVVVRLARRLDEVAAGEWVLFKSIKPFAATPNDTDWFPLNPKRHAELVRHLIQSGEFSLLERAPRQTTLIESAGIGVTDTTKKGGIYYIDCYVFPSTDYFVYLDPRRLRHHVEEIELAGRPIPVLKAGAELGSIMFHNIFPERTLTPESYYLVKAYLDRMEVNGELDSFVNVCREQFVTYAAAINLAFVNRIDEDIFGARDARVTSLLNDLGHPDLEIRGFNAAGAYPFAVPNGLFWKTFLYKQRDPTSFRSTLIQMLHMLNPIFFADVLKIIWRRSVRGGVYEQN